jgi:hypothetical protein
MLIHVEIKCQLDATDEFLLQILLFAQHVSDTFMPIIRSTVKTTSNVNITIFIHVR